MAIHDLFSKRQAQLRQQAPDVLHYDDVPQVLRVQIVRIMSEAWRQLRDFLYVPPEGTVYDDIKEILCHEYGLLESEQLFDGPATRHHDLVRYFLDLVRTERVLDVVQLGFHAILNAPDKYGTRAVPFGGKLSEQELQTAATVTAQRAVQELNDRFREHRVGYQFSGRMIIRVDSEWMHAEVMKRCLVILSGSDYSGAQDEFLRGHEHYRVGNMKEAINECLKSFESVMKVICEKRGWSGADDASASKLISICFEGGLIPSFWSQHFNALQSLLKGGVAPARNKLSAHGQGAIPTGVPRHLVGYVINMTASAILFLTEAEAAGRTE